MPTQRRSTISEHERRRRLLDAAAAVFLAHGYASATMDAIALAAGMSKKTLYQIYPSKLALFDALLGDRIFEISVPEDDLTLSLEDRLTTLLLSLGRALIDKERIALIRLVIADAHDSSALSSCFERVQTERDMNAIERWLTNEKAAGRLDPGPIHDAAKQIFGLTIGEQMIAALIGKRKSDTDLEGFVRRSLRIYLRGVGAGTSDPA